MSASPQSSAGRNRELSPHAWPAESLPRFSGKLESAVSEILSCEPDSATLRIREGVKIFLLDYTDRHAGSNIIWRISNETGGFNQKPTQVNAQDSGETLPGISAGIVK